MNIMETKASSSAQQNNVSVSLETLTTDEAPEDINRIASDIEAQEKQRPELVNADGDSPIPLAQMMDGFSGGGIQYGLKTKNATEQPPQHLKHKATSLQLVQNTLINQS